MRDVSPRLASLPYAIPACSPAASSDTDVYRSSGRDFGGRHRGQ
jgi:hypothetical protein